MKINRVRKGAPWTEQEDQEIRRLCADGAFLEDIAESLGRSSEGVRTRANILGVPCRSRRTTSRSRSASALPKRAQYRLVCRRSDGSTESLKDLDVPDDDAAIAAAQECPAPGGCEVWRAGQDPEMLGRF